MSHNLHQNGNKSPQNLGRKIGVFGEFGVLRVLVVVWGGGFLKRCGVG